MGPKLPDMFQLRVDVAAVAVAADLAVHVRS